MNAIYTHPQVPSRPAHTHPPIRYVVVYESHRERDSKEWRLLAPCMFTTTPPALFFFGIFLSSSGSDLVRVIQSERRRRKPKPPTSRGSSGAPKVEPNWCWLSDQSQHKFVKKIEEPRRVMIRIDRCTRHRQRDLSSNTHTHDSAKL